VAVVFVANKDTEAIDRPDLSLLGHQNELVAAVAAANPRTVVVLNAGSPVTMPWLDDVAGVLQAWYPGEEAGNAAASVLFGDTDPSGRLPITFPRRLEDTPANTPEQYPGVGLVASFSEGLRIGYCHYDARGIEPLFPFGFGLSYTTFRIDDLDVRGRRVSVEVKNTRRRRDSQVVQVYVGGADGSGPDVPPRRLEGFKKVWLAPGRAPRGRDRARPAGVRALGYRAPRLGAAGRILHGARRDVLAGPAAVQGRQPKGRGGAVTRLPHQPGTADRGGHHSVADAER
jgi:beta-glucosidase